MSRLRLFFAGVLACAVVASAAVSLAAAPQDRREPVPTRVEYTVAAASSSRVEADAPVVASRVGIPARRPGLGSVPETLTLVVVGSMLIGLAAAVRRTT